MLNISGYLDIYGWALHVRLLVASDGKFTHRLPILSEILKSPTSYWLFTLVKEILQRVECIYE